MRMENFSASAVKVEIRELWQLCQVKTRFNPSVEQRPLPVTPCFLPSSCTSTYAMKRKEFQTEMNPSKCLSQGQMSRLSGAVLESMQVPRTGRRA